MIKTATDYGADYVLVGALTLFGNGPVDCKTLYYKFLERYFPELVAKYKKLVQDFLSANKGISRETSRNVYHNLQQVRCET